MALLVGVAWPRASTRCDRVLVVALDGARLATVRRLAQDGTMPNVAAFLGRAAGGEVYGGSRRDPRGFWRAALSDRSLPGERAVYIWSRAADAGLRSVAIGIPDTREAVSPPSLVLPGADEVAGFIGDNAGIVVSMAAIKRADLDWPYSSAVRRASEAASVLQSGRPSDWISVALAPPDNRSGMFRIYRLDENAAYLSPVYRGATPAAKYVPGASERLIYVPDDPSWTADSSRLRDYFYLHARDLSGARADLAAELAAGRWPLLVYFEPLVGLVEQAYPAQAGKLANSDPAVLRDAYQTIDTRIGRLAAAAGPRTAVVLLGREPAGHGTTPIALPSGRTMTGFAFIGQVSSTPITAAVEPAHVTRIARTLLHLLDVPREEDPASIQAAAARFRSTGAANNGRRGDVGRRGVPLTSDSLRELGLLSDSARAPAGENVDASAAGSVTE